MDKHLVFFVHGMGTHDDKWHTAGLEVLRKALPHYEAFANDTFDDLVEAQPIVYDSFIETWRARMANDFAAFWGALLGGLTPADAAKKQELSKQLDRLEPLIGTATKPGFAWTHAADVIIYRWCSLLTMPIDTGFIDQITDAIRELKPRRWSIVAHSLGTSVAHNALNTYYTGGLPSGGHLDPNVTRPRVVAMIANVSRVLQRPGAKVYDTVVRPGHASTGAICDYYLNARHKLDPFCYPQAFMPDAWPAPGSFALNAYQHLQPAHIHFSKKDIWRVHDFDHYLENPRVHVPLFRGLFGHKMIGEDEFLRAKTEFDSELADNPVNARDKLDAMLPAPSADWKAILGLILRKWD